jgi:hypothetical protein
MYRVQDVKSPIIKDRIKKIVVLVIPSPNLSRRERNENIIANIPFMGIDTK